MNKRDEKARQGQAPRFGSGCFTAGGMLFTYDRATFALSGTIDLSGLFSRSALPILSAPIPKD